MLPQNVLGAALERLPAAALRQWMSFCKPLPRHASGQNMQQTDVLTVVLYLCPLCGRD
jgi:hypothetical protein